MSKLDNELIIAVRYKQNKERVSQLLKDGANPNAYFDNGSERERAFTAAIRLGNLGIVKAFADYGVDLELSHLDMKPLAAAILYNQFKIAEFLLSQNLDIEKTDRSYGDSGRALSMAIELDRVEIVELLLKAGCSLSVTDRHDKDAVETAAITCSVNSLKILLTKVPYLHPEEDYSINLITTAGFMSRRNKTWQERKSAYFETVEFLVAEMAKNKSKPVPRRNVERQPKRDDNHIDNHVYAYGGWA